MKQTPVKLGPLALLLTVISICLTALAILSFTTSRADMRLAEKYAETVKIRYELESQGQEFLTEAEKSAGSLSSLPGVTVDDDGRTVYRELALEGSVLKIGLVPDGDGFRIVEWRHEREWTPDNDIGNLWNGL